jgi:membrane protease YdiL (CAAX protease family)
MSSTETIPSGTNPPVAQGTGLAGFVRRRPLTSFLLWFFTVGQVFAFAPLVARAYGVELPFQVFIVGSTLFGLLLPALVITRLVDGREGLRTFLRRSVAVWVSLRWYAVALLAVPLLATALAFAFFGTPTADLTAASILSALGFGFLVQTVVALVPNNWAEEMAWMGFFQARLQDRTTPMRAAALTAPLFALQHVALVVGQPLVIGVGLMVFLALVAVPGRAVMAWTYNGSGSLFVVGLVHAAGNAAAGSSGFADGFLPRLYPDADFVGLMHLLAFAVIGLVVIVATRGRLGRATRRTRDNRPARPS